MPAIDSMRTAVCWRPLGSWGPRLKPIGSPALPVGVVERIHATCRQLAAYGYITQCHCWSYTIAFILWRTLVMTMWSKIIFWKCLQFAQRRIFIFGALGYFKPGALLEGLRRLMSSGVRRKFSWGGFGSGPYGGHLYLVFAVCDFTIWRHFHVSKPTFWRSFLT